MNKLKKVLLIDDDEIVNSINKVILQHAKFAEEISAETSAEKGIEILKEGAINGDLPDLIFLDVNMPDMSGWDFIEEFEKMELQDSQPPKVVLLTSSINPRDEQRANDTEQVTAFLSKPLSPELLDMIHEKFLV